MRLWLPLYQRRLDGRLAGASSHPLQGWNAGSSAAPRGEIARHDLRLSRIPPPYFDSGAQLSTALARSFLPDRVDTPPAQFPLDGGSHSLPRALAARFTEGDQEFC